MMSQISVLAPGRVNLLGEHVDYNAGPVLPAAIDRAVRLRVEPLPGRTVRVKAADLGEEVSFNLDTLPEKMDEAGRDLPGWALYPAGVAWALQQRGLQPPGIAASYTSNIPIGAGLSSSAAVEVAFGALWQAAAGWKLDRLELALICQQAEVEYVGVNCGAMDQIASACGVEDHVLRIDMRSIQVEAIPLPADLAIVIADTGLPRSLAGSAYNQRRAACEQAVRILSRSIPGITSLRDVSVSQLNRYAGDLPEPIHMAARHVVEEMARVDEAVLALKAGDVDAFGRLMLAGHASLRDLYLVSTAELDALVEIASGLPGCWGARLTGAGFGGCTVNLVAAEHVEDFIRQLSSQYWQLTGKTPKIYACRASQGATINR